MTQSKPFLEKLHTLLNLLNLDEIPLGLYYTNNKPNDNGPSGKNAHDCLFKYLRIARVKKQPGWISRANPGCKGGSIYTGFTEFNDYIANFVSIGNEKRPGEKYLPSPQSVWNMYNQINRREAPADFCVFKPLDQFDDAETPEVVVFFARGELLTGLCQLAFYAFDDTNALAFPFGSGCANIIAWPIHYLEKNQDKAVIGGSDPSCRPYLETDELTFAVSYTAFKKMLDKAEESFLSGKTWSNVRKKIDKSKNRWQR